MSGWRSIVMPAMTAVIAMWSSPAWARQEASLKVGDPAPKLTIAQWVKGEPVTEFVPGRTYVVEFWATWNGLCRKSIPHLTELQRIYRERGLTVIGVASYERSGPSALERFVQGEGEAIGYTIARDAGTATSDAWMRAAGQDGIPYAFVVDQQGRIAWIGHPAGGLDEVLAKLMPAGDSAVVAAATDPRVAALQAKAEPMIREIRELVAAGQFGKALPIIERVVALDETVFSDWAAYKLRLLLTELKNQQAAGAYAKQLITRRYKDNAAALAQIAVTILQAPGAPAPLVELATGAAESADRLANGTDPRVLAALALARFTAGRVAEAVAMQERAVGLAAERPQLKSELEAALGRYREAAEASGGGG